MNLINHNIKARNILQKIEKVPELAKFSNQHVARSIHAQVYTLIRKQEAAARFYIATVSSNSIAFRFVPCEWGSDDLLIFL